MGDGTGSAQAERTVLATGFAADLARHGQRAALHGADGSLSYAALAERVRSARAELDAVGGSERHLVRLSPEPTVEFVVSWLAALSGGHPALLTHNDGLARAYSASVEHGAHGWRPTGADAPTLHPDLRLLLSTSGSTGSPKLVRLSATNLSANAEAIATYLDLGSDDVALTTLPLDYCYGLSVLHSHLAVGASVMLDARSVTDADLWADARTRGVTSFAGVPYTFDLLGSAGWPELPTLRQVTQAGGRMEPEGVRTLAQQGRRDGWDLVVMYGQTEATARMAYLPPDLAVSHPSAVGLAIPGGTFRLEPVDGAAPGVGELVYSGPNVMLGYAESPADLLRGADVAELHTGDLARFTSDGLVEIVGRQSRFAKLFGQRIDLDRVQTLLALSGHEVVCAESADGHHLVVAVPGSPDAALLAEIAAAAVADTGLPGHAVRAVAVDQVPRRANGKIDQQAVSLLQPGAPDDGSSPAASLVHLYGRILGRDDVTADDSFVSLGGDSLSYVELALRLEGRIGTLPPDWQQRTIADLARRVAGTRRGPWARIDSTIALRAGAIVLIVGSHTDLWTLLGTAHILLAVAGANFARFCLTDEGSRDRIDRTLRAATRIAVPSALWIGAVALLTHQFGWRSILLLNDLTGDNGWSEPAWFYWFIEVVLLFGLLAGLFTALPQVMAFERRHRFALPAGLTALALVPRYWATTSSYGGDVIHSSQFVAWLFLGGWAAAMAKTAPQRALVSALLLVGLWDFTDNAERELMIAAGLAVLVWVPTVLWPRFLVGLTGALASTSLFIYLTHWQVYPHFEQTWPAGGLLLSLAVGVATGHLVHRAPPRIARLLPSRPRHAAHTEGGDDHDAVALSSHDEKETR